MQVSNRLAQEELVISICRLNWEALGKEELTDVAIVYYYFSIQFRENLEIARQLFPDDPKLIELEAGECNTDNLSPWPGVSEAGEKLDHDEFMRRLLELSPIDHVRRAYLAEVGQSYLRTVRAMDPDTRARSIASYEDGGLEAVFRAILRCDKWNSALLRGFRHFLVEHVRFDEDPSAGHGALARHLAPTDAVLPLWLAFRDLFLEAAPGLTR